MAKQTFTTGQVLTAAQMTQLQQTAMLGGDANARTASYVLVAGDAGNAITMSSTSSTTITVNTGIFEAGDIVTIVNINSGVCTITAGTATVTTSGSLALSQNQGGVLRFTSASAAIFLQFATPASGDIEGITTGANSGLTGGVTSGTADLKLNFTAKGQLPVGSGSGTTGFLTVGTNGHTLVADSAETLGVKWAAAASGGGYTLLETLTLSGSSTTSSTLSTSYKHLFVVVKDVYISGNDNVAMRLNGDSNTRYYAQAIEIDNTSISGKNETDGRFYIVDSGNNSAAVNNCYGTIFIPRYTDTSSVVQIESTFSGYIVGNKRGKIVWGFYDNSAAVTSITLLAGTATFSAGTAYIYGVS